MEKKIYTDDFEQLLKEKTDQFRMYPSKRVWHSIYNDLHPGRKWPSVAMSMVLVIALLLIGYLNTGNNTVNSQFNVTGEEQSSIASTNNKKGPNNIKSKSRSFTNGADQRSVEGGYENPAYKNILIAAENILTAIITADNSLVKNVDAGLAVSNNDVLVKNPVTDKNLPGTESKDILQAVDTYIKSNQIFNDVAVVNKKKSTKTKPVELSKSNTVQDTDQDEFTGTAAFVDSRMNGKDAIKTLKPTANDLAAATQSNSLKTGNSKTAVDGNSAPTGQNKTGAANKTLSAEDKAWMEHYAMYNKSSSRNKWKGRLGIEMYVTPAVDYRVLSVNSEGSTTPFANKNVDEAVSQNPGLGIEAGIGLSYAFAKNVRLKAGLQFNLTNYNVNVDATTHPVLTSLLFNDPTTGYSYAATRTSVLSNPANSYALQPVTVHNTTHQISIPIGISFKLASRDKLEWFAGASIQPTYVFGGKAHLISADLKDYVTESALIRSWNLNTGFETYINYKMGGFSLHAGPQLRYQLFSTYNKKYALIEKPYAVGLKLGLVKGF